MMYKLKVCEIFLSLQGESSFVGLPCVFVRTSGCPLECRWCDTTYAKTEGHDMILEEILGKVAGLGWSWWSSPVESPWPKKRRPA